MLFAPSLQKCCHVIMVWVVASMATSFPDSSAVRVSCGRGVISRPPLPKTCLSVMKRSPFCTRAYSGREEHVFLPFKHSLAHVCRQEIVTLCLGQTVLQFLQVIGGCMDSTRIALKDSVLWADEWSSFFPEVTFDTHKGTCCATAAH